MTDDDDASQGGAGASSSGQGVPEEGPRQRMMVVKEFVPPPAGCRQFRRDCKRSAAALGPSVPTQASSPLPTRLQAAAAAADLGPLVPTQASSPLPTTLQASVRQETATSDVFTFQDRPDVTRPWAAPGQPVVSPPNYGQWFPGDRRAFGTSHWRNDVLSDVNLSSFLSWANDAPEAEVRLVISLLPIVEHRRQLDLLWALATDVPVTTKYGPLRQLDCDRPGRHRCGRKGGYSFGWCDSRWTPQLAIVDAIHWGRQPPTPDETRAECLRTPWPRGAWRAPDGQS